MANACPRTSPIGALATSISGNGASGTGTGSGFQISERVLKKSVGAARQSNGLKKQTSFCIVDSQSMSRTRTPPGIKGFDAGKKVSGIKRHIAVDTQGLRQWHTRDYVLTLPTGLGLWRCWTGAETASVKCRTCCWTGVIPESRFATCAFKECWLPRWKW